MTQEIRWEGAEKRECSEHRSVGGRAWCHDCTEWCYPSMMCKGCRIPILEEQVAQLEGDYKAMFESKQGAWARVSELEDFIDQLEAKIVATQPTDWPAFARKMLDDSPEGQAALRREVEEWLTE